MYMTEMTETLTFLHNNIIMSRTERRKSTKEVDFEKLASKAPVTAHCDTVRSSVTANMNLIGEQFFWYG